MDKRVEYVLVRWRQDIEAPVIGSIGYQIAEIGGTIRIAMHDPNDVSDEENVFHTIRKHQVVDVQRLFEEPWLNDEIYKIPPDHVPTLNADGKICD